MYWRCKNVLEVLYDHVNCEVMVGLGLRMPLVVGTKC